MGTLAGDLSLPASLVLKALLLAAGFPLVLLLSRMWTPDERRWIRKTLDGVRAQLVSA